MADANSTVSNSSVIKDKFRATNYAICQASFLAHFLALAFLALAISQQVEADENVVRIENPASEGFLTMLNQLAASIENLISLLDECERAVENGN
jgi:hypothetical protein